MAATSKWAAKRALQVEQGQVQKEKALEGIVRCEVQSQIVSNDLPKCDDDDEFDNYLAAKEKAALDLIAQHGKDVQYLIVKTDYFGQMFSADGDYNPAKDPDILYVYDDLWGKGLYLGAGEEPDRRELMSIMGIEDGIYLKVAGAEHIRDKIEFLMGLEYCGCFYWNTLDEVIVTTSANGVKVMSVSFDTEHG